MGRHWRSAGATQALAMLAATVVAADAQTFTVLHTFTGGGGEGANPYAGLILDKAGNLYGTTLNGGLWQHGTVFKLDTTGVLTTLHSFERRGDGNKPYGGVVQDPSGNLFGMTPTGIGTKFARGIVYRIGTNGKEAKPHVFAGPPSDGENPLAGLIRDPSGNLYGTTGGGGSGCDTGGQGGCGIVFKVSKGNETVLYNFTGSSTGDGAHPEGTLVRDKAGNLYGTTLQGGNPSAPFGTVFKLDTTGREIVLHTFGLTDGPPCAGLMLDQTGNLYGTTSAGDGLVFRMDTSGNSYSILYTFAGGSDGSEALGTLVMDETGNLYGTTRYGGDLSCGQSGEGCGVVFELKATGQEIVLHTFSGPDGMAPSSGLVRDSAGNLYGTAPRGGNIACVASGCGVVFKLTP